MTAVLVAVPSLFLPTLTILTPPIETPDPPNDTPRASKQVCRAKRPDWLGYIGDYTAQLSGGYTL